ncbi:hypothetical protein [Halobellus litoreus]|uniref:VanZ like family protein n=1 Tax=Halobellus litoreus TaxID=755310 RepID=A0ABD6DQS2_9EURY
MTGRTRGDAPGVRWSGRRARRVAVGWIGLVVLASVVDPSLFGPVDAPTTTPTDAGPTGSFDVDVFALSHVVAYGVLGWLVAVGIARGPGSERNGDVETTARSGTAAGLRTALAAVAVAAAVGLGVELVQAPLAARTASSADALLNAAGAGVAVGARTLLQRARR